MLKSSLKPKAICFFDRNSLCKIMTKNVEKDKINSILYLVFFILQTAAEFFKNSDRNYQWKSRWLQLMFPIFESPDKIAGFESK